MVLGREVIVGFDDLHARQLSDCCAVCVAKQLCGLGLSLEPRSRAFTACTWWRSVSMSSNTTNMSLNSRALGGSITCFISTISAVTYHSVSKPLRPRCSDYNPKCGWRGLSAAEYLDAGAI